MNKQAMIVKLNNMDKFAHKVYSKIVEYTELDEFENPENAAIEMMKSIYNYDITNNKYFIGA